MTDLHDELREIIVRMRIENPDPDRDAPYWRDLGASEREAALASLGDRHPELDEESLEAAVDGWAVEERARQEGATERYGAQEALAPTELVGYPEDLTEKEKDLLVDSVRGPRWWARHKWELGVAALFLTAGVVWVANTGGDGPPVEEAAVQAEHPPEQAGDGGEAVGAGKDEVVAEDVDDLAEEEIAAAVEMEFPPHLEGLVGVLRDAGMDDEAIAVALGGRISDATGDWFFSRSDTPAGNGGPDVDQLGSVSFWVEVGVPAAIVTLFGNTTFPCGETAPDGTVTVCSRDAVQDMPAGEIAVVAQVLAAPAAAEAPAWQYTYAVVSDTDGDAGNDFQFQPPFDFDLFRDTDTWWVVDNVDGVWSMGRFAADFAAPLPSATRVVIRDNAMVWFVPRAELPAPTGVRTTSFRHDGTFAPEASGGDVIGADPTQPLVPIAELDLPLDPQETPDVVAQSPTPPERQDGDAGDGEAAVRAFVASFEQALASGDVDFLAARLDPAVIGRYGEARCRDYLASIVGSARDFEVLEVRGPVAISYVTDGIEQSVGEGYDARVRFQTSGGSPVEATPIYRIDASTVHWFTDCGEPR